MNDKKWIVLGLIVFFAIVLFPVWYNRGKAAPAPEVWLSDKAKAAETCVKPLDDIRRNHMHLLDQWRDTVSREGKRVFVAWNGKEYYPGLTTTCLGCHEDKAQFCDRCHNYASVSPYCWDCHINPKEMNYGKQ